MLASFFVPAKKKRKYLLIINIFILNLFFLGCQSSKNNYQTSVKKSLQFEKALIFYASDDPIWLPYFSNVFTRRISEEGIFEAVQNHDLGKEWILNSVGNRGDINLENKFLQFSNKIKDQVKNGKIQKARQISIVSMKEASILLIIHPPCLFPMLL